MMEPTAAPRTATTLAGKSRALCCSNQQRPTIMETRSTSHTATTLVGKSGASCCSNQQRPTIMETRSTSRTATTLAGKSRVSCCSNQQRPTIMETRSTPRTATTLAGKSRGSCCSNQQRPTIMETRTTSRTATTLVGKSGASCCSTTQHRPSINAILKNSDSERPVAEIKTSNINYDTFKCELHHPVLDDASVLENMSKLWGRFLDVPHAVLLFLAGVLVKITFLLFGISSLREAPLGPARRHRYNSMTIPSQLRASSEARLSNTPIASPSNAVVPVKSQQPLVPHIRSTVNRQTNAFPPSQLRAPSVTRLNYRPIASPSIAVVPMKSQQPLVSQIKSSFNWQLNALMSSRPRSSSVIGINSKPIASPSNAVVPVRNQRPLLPQIRPNLTRQRNAFTSAHWRAPSMIKLNNRPIVTPSNAVIPVKSQRDVVPQSTSTVKRHLNVFNISSQLRASSEINQSNRPIVTPSNAVIPVKSQRDVVPQSTSTVKRHLNVFNISSQLRAPSEINQSNRPIVTPPNAVVPVKSQPSLVPQIRSDFNRPLNKNIPIVSPPNTVVPVKSQRHVASNKSIISWAITSMERRNENFKDESRVQAPTSLFMPLEEFKPHWPHAFELQQEQRVTEAWKQHSMDAVKNGKELDLLSPLAPKAVTIPQHLPAQTKKISKDNSLADRELVVPCILEIQNVKLTLALPLAGICEVSGRLCVVFRTECIVQVNCSNAVFKDCMKIMREIGLPLPTRLNAALTSPDTSILPGKRSVALKQKLVFKKAGETFSHEFSQKKLIEEPAAEETFHSRVSSQPKMEVAIKNASIIQPVVGEAPPLKDKVHSFPAQGKSSRMRSPLSPTEINKLEEAFARLHGRKKSFTRPPASFALRKSLGPPHFANEQSELQSKFSENQLLYYTKVQQLQRSVFRKGHNEVMTGHSLAFLDKPKHLPCANGSRKPQQEVTSKHVTTMAAFPRSSRDSCHYAKLSPNGRSTSTQRTSERRIKENVTLRDSKAVLSPPPPSSRLQLQESARPFGASFKKRNACTPCSSATVSSIESKNTQDANAHKIDSSLFLSVKDVPIARKLNGNKEKNEEKEPPSKEVESTPVESPQSSRLQSSLEVQKEAASLEIVKSVVEEKTVVLDPSDQRPENNQSLSTSGAEEGSKFGQPAQEQPSVSGLQASLEGLAVALRRASNRAECAAFSFALEAEEEQGKTPSLATGPAISEAQRELENTLGKLENGPTKAWKECVSKSVEPTPSSGIQNSLEGLASSSEKEKEQSASSDKRTAHAHSLGKRATTNPRLNVVQTNVNKFTQFCKEYFEKSVGSKTVLSPPLFGFIESVNRLILANRKASLLKENRASGRKRSSKRRKRQKHNKKRHRKHLKPSASSCSLPKQTESNLPQNSIEGSAAAPKSVLSKNSSPGSSASPSKKGKEQSASSDKRTGHAHSVSLGKRFTTNPRQNVRETNKDKFTQFCKEYFEKSVGSKTVLSPPSFGFIESVNRLILANRKASLQKENRNSGRKRSSKRRKRQNHNKKRHRKHSKTSVSACSLPKQKDSKRISLSKVAVREVKKDDKMLIEDSVKGSKTDPNKRSSLIEAEKALKVTSDILETANSCLQLQIASLTTNDNTNERKQQENHDKPACNVVGQLLPAAKTSSERLDEDSVSETKSRNTELSMKDDPVQTALPKDSTEKKPEDAECVNPSYRPPSLKEIKEAAQNIRNMFSFLFVTHAQKDEKVVPFVQELQTHQPGYQEHSVCQQQNTNTLILEAQETDQIHSSYQTEVALHMSNSMFRVAEDTNQANSIYPLEAEVKVDPAFQLAQVTDIQNKDQASTFQGSPNAFLEGEISNHQIQEKVGYEGLSISQLQNAALPKLVQDISTVDQDPVLQMDSYVGSKTQGSSVIDKVNSMVHQSMDNHVAPVGEIHAVNGSTVPELEISGQFNIKQSLSGLTFHVSGDASTSVQRLLERIQVSGNVDIQRLPSVEGLNISTNLNIIPSTSGGQSAFIQDEALALEEEVKCIQSTKIQLEDVVALNVIEPSADEGLPPRVPFVPDVHEGVAMARLSEAEHQVPEYLEARLLSPKESFPVQGSTDMGTSVLSEEIHSNMQQKYDELQTSKLPADKVEAVGNPEGVERTDAADVVSSPFSEEHIHVPTPLPAEVGLEYRDQMSSVAVPIQETLASNIPQQAVLENHTPEVNPLPKEMGMECRGQMPSSPDLPSQGTVAADIPSQASTTEHQTWESNVQSSKSVSRAQEEILTDSRDTTTESTQKTPEAVFSAEKSAKETLLRIYTPQKYSHGVDEVVMSRAAELIENGIFVVSDSGTVDAIVHPNRVSREEGSPEMCTFSSTFNQHDVLPVQFQQKIIRSAQDEGLNNRVITAESTRPCDVPVRGQIIEDCDGDQIMLDAPKPTRGLFESRHHLANYLNQPCMPDGHITQMASYHLNEPQKNVDIDMMSDGQESPMDTASRSNSQTSVMDCEDCTDQVLGQYCRFCKEIQSQKTSLASLPTSQIFGQPKPKLVSRFDGNNELDRLAMYGLENIVQKPCENQTQILSTEGKETPYSVAGNVHGFQATAAAGRSEQTSIFNVPSAVVRQGHLDGGVTQTLLSSSNNVQGNGNQGIIPGSNSPSSQGICAVQYVFTKVLPSVEGHENTDVSAVIDESCCPNPLAQNTQAQNKDSAPSNCATDTSVERVEGTRESEGLSPVAPSILDLCASIDIENTINEVPTAAKNLEDQKKHLPSDKKASTPVSDALINNSKSDKAESLSTETGTSSDCNNATSLLKMNGSNETSKIFDTNGNFIDEYAPYLGEKLHSSDCNSLQLLSSEQTTSTFLECSVAANATSSTTTADLTGQNEMEKPLQKPASLDEQCCTTSNEKHVEAITAKQPLASITPLLRVMEERTSVVDARRKVIVPRKRVLHCSTERKVISLDELFGEDRRFEFQASSLSSKKRLREPIAEVSDEESSTELKRRRKVRFSEELQVCQVDNLHSSVNSGRFVPKPTVPRKGILKSSRSRMTKG